MSKILHQSGDVTITNKGDTLQVDIFTPFNKWSGGTRDVKRSAQGFSLRSFEQRADAATKPLIKMYAAYIEDETGKTLNDNQMRRLRRGLVDTAMSSFGACEGEYYEVTPEAQNYVAQNIDRYETVEVKYSGVKPATHRGFQAVHG